MDAVLIYRFLGAVAMFAVFGTAAVFAWRRFRSDEPETDDSAPILDPFAHRTFGQTGLPNDSSSSSCDGGTSA